MANTRNASAKAFFQVCAEHGDIFFLSSAYMPLLSDTAYIYQYTFRSKYCRSVKGQDRGSSIHPSIFLTAYPARVKGMLEHIPGATGQDAGYNQDRLPVIRLEQRGRQPPTFPSKPMDK